jgi:SWI/SNF-related matrix-associated actin-dependent regulator 1 of chromatin subfamily A
MNIETLVSWSDPKEVETKHGPRMLRKAEATPAFWDAWKAHKDELKAAGVSCSRDDRSGEWSAMWWQQISAEVKAERAQAVEASRATSADIDLPRPEGLDYMPFQKAGIRYALAHPNVLIGDEMGLGKTIQAIGIINSDPAIESAVVICPKSLKLNWKRELTKWLTRPLSIGVVNGKGWPETDIVILNYEATGKFREQLLARTWGALILDEAHLIKNSKTLRSKNIKGDSKTGMEPIHATRHIRLTGTPIVNRPAELYNIISDLANFGSFYSFAKRYCQMHSNGYGWDFSGASNLDELQRKLREKVMVRRLKADVLTELPAKIRQIVEVELDSADMKNAVGAEQSYEDASEERLADLRAAVELSKAESDEAYKAAVNRLREAEQVDFTEMSRLRHETALAKVPAVIAHIENALEDNEEKVIVMAHHHDVIDALTQALAQFNPVNLTGKENDKQRDAAVYSFQNDPRTRVFIGSIMAAGVGITLTKSHFVVFGELDWVPGNVTQAEDRAHRIGQTETVLIQHIVLSGSLDARMAQTLVNKQAVIDSALDKNHPERKAPVYEPKQKAATHEAKPDLLAKIAVVITDEQITTIHTGLRILAGMDYDGARELNDVGFNKLDTQIGRSLAERMSLTPKQAALGAKLLKKYHRQLPEEINETVQTVTTVESEKK